MSSANGLCCPALASLRPPANAVELPAEIYIQVVLDYVEDPADHHSVFGRSDLDQRGPAQQRDEAVFLPGERDAAAGPRNSPPPAAAGAQIAGPRRHIYHKTRSHL